MRRLLIRPGAIGDCIVSLPALESLRSAYTEVWVASPNIPLIRFADRVRPIAATGIDLLGIPGLKPADKLLEELRSFDSIVSWYGANRPEFRQAMAGLGLRVDFFPALPSDASGIHAVDFYLSQVGAPLGVAPRLCCPRRNGGSAVIHPFSGSSRKNWPLECFQKLAGRLAERLPVVWCTGPDQPLEGAQCFENLYELACWLAEARVYIGNDSGISHLAAAVGTPVIALFGPTDPDVWGPRGAHVRIVKSPSGDPMSSISVKNVLAVVQSLC